MTKPFCKETIEVACNSTVLLLTAGQCENIVCVNSMLTHYQKHSSLLLQRTIYV